MAGGGNAIRGSRVGAGPMGEAERGEAAPRQAVTYFCSHEHRSVVTFAVEAAVPDSWDCPRCGLPASLDSENPPPAAEDRAVQDPPGLREGAALRRGGRGHPRRGARHAPGAPQVRRDHLLEARRGGLVEQPQGAPGAARPGRGHVVRVGARGERPSTASALSSPLTTNHTSSLRLSAGKVRLIRSGGGLGESGDADRDRVVDVELREAGEQRGDVAVGSDAEHHHVEPAAALLAQRVGVRRRRRRRRRGGPSADGHLVHVAGSTPTRSRSASRACPALRSRSSAATKRSSPHQKSTRVQSTSLAAAEPGDSRWTPRRWCRR